MKKFPIKVLSFVLLLGLSFSFVYADTAVPPPTTSSLGNFIPCGGPDCTFESLITLVKAVINGLIKLATLVTTGVLAYAGFKMLFSGGSESVWKDAKEMMTKTIIGYMWILVAWTLIYTITSLLDPGFSLLGKPN